MAINRVAVIGSTNVKSMGHDPTTKTLEVEYNNGGVYQYENVGVDKYNALRAAKSVGGHLAKHVKGYHKARKV